MSLTKVYHIHTTLYYTRFCYCILIPIYRKYIINKLSTLSLNSSSYDVNNKKERLSAAAAAAAVET